MTTKKKLLVLKKKINFSENNSYKTMPKLQISDFLLTTLSTIYSYGLYFIVQPPIEALTV